MASQFSNWQKILLVLAVVIPIYLVQIKPPEFFDKFGLIIFTFIGVLGGWMLYTKKEAPDIIGFILILIAVLGLSTDGAIVIKSMELLG